jgi:hypothetical protein
LRALPDDEWRVGFELLAHSGARALSAHVAALRALISSID